MGNKILEDLLKGISRQLSNNSVERKELEAIGRSCAWEITAGAAETYLADEKLKGNLRRLILADMRKEVIRRKSLRLVGEQPRRRERASKKEVERNEAIRGTEFIDPAINLYLEEAKPFPYAEIYRQIQDKKRKLPLTALSRTKNGRAFVKGLMRHIIDEEERIHLEEVTNKVNWKFMKDRGLHNLLWVVYRTHLEMLREIYEGDREVTVWEVEKPRGFWSGEEGYENALEAVKYLIKERKVRTLEDCKNITVQDFVDLKIVRALTDHFEANPYLALKTQFPELNFWQSKRTSPKFLGSKEHQKEALIAFLMHYGFPSISGLNAEETYGLGLRGTIKCDTMDDFGLRGLRNRFGNSVYRAFKHHFPNQILPWTFGMVNCEWKTNPREKAAVAGRWLFEDYLHIDMQDIPHSATEKMFRHVGFSGMLTSRKLNFGWSPFAFVDNAYPGRFSRDDFFRGKAYFKRKKLEAEKK